MSWEDSLRTLQREGIGEHVTHLRTIPSSVTTSWGVHWDEVYIARDIMQNFFDANRTNLQDVRVLVETMP